MSEIKIRVYYEDTDCGGIVYHTNYIKYCERARSELFFSHKLLPSQGTSGFVVSSINADFLGFARLGDELLIRTHLHKLGKVQIHLQQDIYRLESLVDSAIQPQADITKLESTIDSATKSHTHIFRASVRLGYVNVLSKTPEQIPEVFLALLRTLPPLSSPQNPQA